VPSVVSVSGLSLIADLCIFECQSSLKLKLDFLSRFTAESVFVLTKAVQSVFMGMMFCV